VRIYSSIQNKKEFLIGGAPLFSLAMETSPHY